MSNLFDKLAQYEEMVKTARIRKLPDGKYRVLSEKGKNLGTYPSKSQAVKRLRQVEYFKHHDSHSNDDYIDLTDIDDFSYSAVVRKIREKAPKQINKFLEIFKSEFDKGIQKKIQSPEKIALQISLIKFNKLFPIKINKLLKKAAVSELGDADSVGKHLANIVHFILTRIAPDKRQASINNLKNKFTTLNVAEISNKQMSPGSALGQSITFVKHVLFNHDPNYIKIVLNSLVRNL